MNLIFNTLLIDMDGVLWHEDVPIGNLKEIFDELRKTGIKTVFLSNNSTRTPSDYVKKLAGFGVIVDEKSILTSATMMAAHLKHLYSEGGPLFIIGESGLIQLLSESGFYHQNNNVLAVVGGLDRETNYLKLKRAINLLIHGAPFYFTNSDATLPTPEGAIPGAGAILAALEAASGKKATLFGKPSPEIFREAMRRHDAVSETTLVVGDRLETDIQGGINAGLHTALVLSGVSGRDSILQSGIQPEFVFKDLSELVSILSAAYKAGKQ